MFFMNIFAVRLFCFGGGKEVFVKKSAFVEGVVFGTPCIKG